MLLDVSGEKIAMGKRGSAFCGLSAATPDKGFVGVRKSAVQPTLAQKICPYTRLYHPNIPPKVAQEDPERMNPMSAIVGSYALRHIKVLASVFLALPLTACYSAYQETVTYHVEFVADGIPYSVTSNGVWYHGRNVSYDTEAVDFNADRIRGTLKDGTKYVISGKNFSFYKFGRTTVQSTIYLRTDQNTLESFDNVHTNSMHHTVNIIKSYISIGNRQQIPYRNVENAVHAQDASLRSAKYYYTVVATVTPFKNSKQALDSFYSENSDIESSDADITYDGKFFHAKFPSSDLAITWVLAPDIDIRGVGEFRGSRPDILVEFDKKQISINSMAMTNAGIDAVTGKAIIFRVDDAFLSFL
ncbi:MAG TPA: hypothetical protein VFW88_01275 [Burkholderiales bacterium]|nr:hypothetical protein [Burkholderiales bacterium]